MGKWAEVQCGCVNRTPLPGSDPSFDRPHRKKHRLTKRQRAEVAEWKQTTENMFACGHRGGLVIELCPYDIIRLGKLLGTISRGSTFEIFTKVGDWRCYEDELLLIQPDEAYLWLKEIEALQMAFGGARNLFTDELDDLVSRYHSDDLAVKKPDMESTIEKILEALKNAAKLCHASMEIGTPIRMMW